MLLTLFAFLNVINVMYLRRVSQDMTVWKLNTSHCVIFLSEFMLICAPSRWLSSLYFRIMKNRQKKKSSLCQINRAKHVFRKNLLITVINALVFSKLYYCSSLWSNTSCSNLSRLQGVQNFAARVVSNRRKFDHITPILKEQRCFPVKSHLYSRDALSAFKCMNDCALAYLSCVVAIQEILNSCMFRYTDQLQEKQRSITELSLSGTTLTLT
jgi:hypothetical protein